MGITEMTKDEMLENPMTLFPCRLFSKEEFFHIARVTDAFWQYNYKKAAEEGVVGLHAKLKSGLHSDAFFVSRILLKERIIQEAFAEQMLLVLLKNIVRHNAHEKSLGQKIIKKVPKWVAGIPDGATKLGKDLANLMRVKNAEVIKKDGKIEVVTSIPKGEPLLLVEDFCTRGTGWKEAVSDIMKNQPHVEMIPFALVALNRGNMKKIKTEKGDFEIISIVDHVISSWQADDCLLCKMGSVPIKPKETDKNWKMITTSQK